MRPVWIYLLFGSVFIRPQRGIPAIYVGITSNPALRSRNHFEGRSGLPPGFIPEQFVPVIEIATRKLGYVVESALAQALRQRLTTCVVLGGFLSRQLDRYKIASPNPLGAQ
jgi:hypothetical protein